MKEFKVGDKVKCLHPVVVCDDFKDVVGVIEKVRWCDGAMVISYEDDLGPETQIAYTDLDGVVLVEAANQEQDSVNHPSHYGQGSIQSDGGPSSYYDFDPDWKTWNDFADYKSRAQWKEHSFHLGNVGKSICRWGDKYGTTKSYDSRKIVYSGLRVLMMLEGKQNVRTYLKSLLSDLQFED